MLHGLLRHTSSTLVSVSRARAYKLFGIMPVRARYTLAFGIPSPHLTKIWFGFASQVRAVEIKLGIWDSMGYSHGIRPLCWSGAAVLLLLMGGSFMRPTQGRQPIRAVS